MTTNSSDYPNIRTSVPKKIGSAHEESIVIDREFFDCVNINGPVDNSGCTTENSLCNPLILFFSDSVNFIIVVLF